MCLTTLYVSLMSFLDRPSISPRAHEVFVQRYGRSIRVRGVGPVSKFHAIIANMFTLRYSGMSGSLPLILFR
jgi:hypothetical protein